MKNISYVSPSKFKIIHSMCNINIFLIDNVKKIKDKDRIRYEYDEFYTSLNFRPDIEKYVNDNFEMLLEKAKKEDYEREAKKVREIRNQLLAESDNMFLIDRLNLEVPSGNTFASWKPFLIELGEKLTNSWAKYRQELRDITKQSGFPYDVKFPEKPE